MRWIWLLLVVAACAGTKENAGTVVNRTLREGTISEAAYSTGSGTYWLRRKAAKAALGKLSFALSTAEYDHLERSERVLRGIEIDTADGEEIIAWRRPDTLEIATKDGAIRVERFLFPLGHRYRLSLRRGNTTTFLGMKSGDMIHAGWGELQRAVESDSVRFAGWHGERPLDRLRDVGVDMRGLDAR
ncbi:MAG: hypothetical protein AAGD14_03275 [Planctomycetota bacterium]